MRDTSTRLTGLYAIADTALLKPSGFEDAIRKTLIGGASLIQYRDKTQDKVRREMQANTLVSLCRKYSALSIINDDIALAAGSGADGVHLGADDAAVNEARRALPDKLIGASCYNQLDLAEEAFAAGADYIALGAVYPSRVKPDAVIAPVNLLQQARQIFSQPICAIGGINSTNISEVLATGVDMAAVISAIFSEQDIVGTTQALASQFRKVS